MTNHIDEGTIHAWLDGALPADEAGRVEGHVEQCASCAAAVAEARGLIAGASRILTALDDVPGAVVPKRVPAAPPARRRWRAAPWVTGIAAAMILAVGIVTWNSGSARMAGDMTVMSSLESKAVADTTPPAAAPAPAIGSARERDEQRRDAGPALAKRSGGASGTIASGRGAVVAAAPAPPPASADTKRDEARVADFSASRRQAIVANADAADSGASKPANQARAELLSRAVVTSAVLSDADTAAATLAMAGCYRLGAPEEREAANVAQRAAGAVSAATSAARSRAASPAPASAERAYAASATPTLVRLDTARVRVGFAARDQRTNAYLGSWQRTGDSLRVELVDHGAFLLAAKDRVECPGR